MASSAPRTEEVEEVEEVEEEEEEEEEPDTPNISMASPLTNLHENQPAVHCN